MFWNISFELMPDEEILDDSTRRHKAIVKSAYSIFLTNRRALFRFDGLGSSLTQSFFYNEIIEVYPSSRFFIHYLTIKTPKKEFLMNVPDPDYWVKRISGIKEHMTEAAQGLTPSALTPEELRRRELITMLENIKKSGLLTEHEYEEKIRQLGPVTR